MNITDKGIPRGLLVSASAFVRQKIRCKMKGVSYGWSLFQTNGEALAIVMSYLEQNKIAATIDAEFDLESITEAQLYLEEGQANGKVMICLS
jgi:NADPH:quinone reductase-like Zn-dependent oxidoreductase